MTTAWHLLTNRCLFSAMISAGYLRGSAVIGHDEETRERNLAIGKDLR